MAYSVQGTTFTADNGSGVKRQFAVYGKNITVTTSNGIATVTIQAVGLRKVAAGTTNLNFDSSYNTYVLVTLAGATRRFAQTSTFDMTGTPPVDAKFNSSNITFSITQQSTAVTYSGTIYYSRTPSSAQYAATSAVGFYVTIPAASGSTSSTEVQSLTAFRSNSSGTATEGGQYIRVEGELSNSNYTSVSGTVSINSYTYTLNFSGTSFYYTAYLNPSSATVSVSITLSFSDGTTKILTDSTYVSGTACAIDFYYGDLSGAYNVGIGTRASEEVSSDNIIDIEGRTGIVGDVTINPTGSGNDVNINGNVLINGSSIPSGNFVQSKVGSGRMLDWGSVTVSVSGTSATSASITFNSAFTQTPFVICSVTQKSASDATKRVAASVQSVSTTGATLQAFGIVSGVSGDVHIRWLAMGY